MGNMKCIGCESKYFFKFILLSSSVLQTMTNGRVSHAGRKCLCVSGNALPRSIYLDDKIVVPMFY